MVQGNTKGLQKKNGGNSRHAQKAAANPKKGLRSIAPKKTQAVKHAAMRKELSAKINRSVEQQMVNAASSGPLTIMKNIGDAPGSSTAAKKKK